MNTWIVTVYWKVNSEKHAHDYFVSAEDSRSAERKGLQMYFASHSIQPCFVKVVSP